MSEEQQALRGAVLHFMQECGQVGFYQTMRALELDAPAPLYEVWEQLMRDQDIEVVPGFHPNVFLAKYQLRVQARLF